MYNATVPPVILDGGKEVLLANFYGQRKCASQNGGLAKPIPEHTYAVVQRVPVQLPIGLKTCQCIV